ncbi:hypothetical protein BFL35_08435 [Clavibacter michiganensis]|uniref:Uncharacterized protein n=2 Tax=Clavibacter michiganensis TaxID=28447 RepID=A0A251Z316_9MICO|nr:hypothetical protein BFL34_01740 [Clavibacter michiganensis]OUE30773.1 hypothetical protein BFL35_08435 [Clavibacter michiganensis]
MDVDADHATYVDGMNISYKKRAVNLGFGIGIAFLVVGLLMIWFLPAVWSGWATFVVVVGVLAALVGFVFAIVPARDQR